MNKDYRLLLFIIFSLLIQSDFSTAQKFAVIGDYGSDGANEAAVASMVINHNPDFIITTGDNNYPVGAANTIDMNIGKYYHDYIFPYSGTYGAGADTNKFFPSLGNHDWASNYASAYLNYFFLPGNERYYDFIKGSVHFFVIDSDPAEPDGIDSSSVQARWLKNGLQSSTSCWNIVYFHHSPFCSDAAHGSDPMLQWPFKQWGADAVLTGHSHVYERLVFDGFPYFVCGLGGRSIYSFSSTPLANSVVRYNSSFGAMLVDAGCNSIKFNFINVSGDTIDTYKVTKSPLMVAEYLPDFEVYPNPTEDYTEILTKLDHSENAEIELYNLLGEKVYYQAQVFSSGRNIIRINMKTLCSGSYMGRIRMTSEEIKFRILKR